MEGRIAMSALPLPQAQQRSFELTEEFLENISRRFLSLLPASMTPAQRQAGTAAFIGGHEIFQEP
jgi:hypothetical protein